MAREPEFPGFRHTISLRCAAVGLGWTALPAITATEQISNGSLQVLDGPVLPDCEVHALLHSRRYLTPATSAVLQQLRHTWSLCAS
ncbi:LysR substrate-binding domain-containing protein [Nesterenkonia ebinurensis]|uniref:LysR substrate-binding domain-containing protein n=1 Tax=Nesterenkonia ebinurensis TaxID=2608252 RepID=UPI001CC50B50